jgi:exonuclease SbcD
MSEPIRLLHFADLHIGMENYGRLDPETGTSSRVRDFLDRLDEVVNYAIEGGADLVVFAGDAFKNRDPEPTQKREFAKRIKRLADEVPTLLLVGNHDMPGMAAKANSMDIFQALDVDGVIVGNTNGSRVVETKRGPVFVAWLPYPMRNRLLSWEEHQGKSIQELQLALREVVSGYLDELAVEADTHAIPRVLVGHFPVDVAKYGSERTVMLGQEMPILLSMLAEPTWDYVALGHIHKHQSLNEDRYPPVVYSGSLERIDFGEEREEKGFCWVELVRGETMWKFMPVAARPFKTVKVDARTAEDPTHAVLMELEGGDFINAVVRVQVMISAAQEALLREREIEKALSEAAHVSIIREVESDVRVRLHDVTPEALTPLELLERYFHSRGLDEERVKALMLTAEDLIHPKS